MYLKHYQLKQEPFPVSPDTHIFYPGGGREKVVQHVLEDLAAGITLIHLCGEEGSGKTLVCQLIWEKLHLDHTVVLLADPAATFDEVGQQLALALGENDTESLVGTVLYEKLFQQLSDLSDDCGSLLLIIDDAEKWIPGVMEEILRFVGDVHPQGRVQLVLAGQLAIGANPEQFNAIRSEFQLRQFTYTLQPLDRDDTAGYLVLRLTAAGIADERENSVFSSEAIARIHEITCGNLGLINIFAQEALRNSCKDKLLRVLAEHVKAPAEYAPVSRLRSNRSPKPPKRYRKTVPAFWALIIVIAVIIADYRVLWRDTEPARHVEEIPTGMGEISTAPKDAANGPDEQSSRPEEVASVTEEIPALVEALPTTVLAPAMHVPPPPPSRTSSPEIITAHISPLQIKKKRLSGSEIFEIRKKAARAWLSGKQKGRYTIQILRANSPSVEKNLAKIFESEVYQNVQDQLYILPKSRKSSTIFVYYGMYDSAQEARQARDRLPDTIKKSDPFPLAIADAVKKSSK